MRIRLIVLLMFGLFIRSIMAQETTVIVEDLVEGNTTFAFDLYRSIAESEQGNLLFSPYSVSQALAMTYAGAQGNTAEQMAEVLHIRLEPENFHRGNVDLAHDLNQGVETPPEAEPFTLKIANSIWGQAGFPFSEPFIHTLDQFYDAGLNITDFVGDPEGARVDINDWIADATADRIEDIIPPGAITPDMRLVLANAIFFKANWLTLFDENLTTDGDFTRLDGSTVSVPMMNQTETLGYMQSEGFQAVRLPYFGDNISMIVTLPDMGNFEAFEQQWDASTLQDVVKNLTFEQVQVQIPRFEYEASVSLSKILQELGMVDAFNPDADFGGMYDRDEVDANLFIGDVRHKAFIKVDEEGTEAAAATVVMMELTSMMPSEPYQFIIDRPFIYTIYDDQTGSVLFMGRVLDPS